MDEKTRITTRRGKSLTDMVLTLCASGRVGLREAIAQATYNTARTKSKKARRQGHRIEI
jgi:hypothetical protein